MSDALAVVEALKADIASGKLVSFCVAAIDDNDGAYAYVGSSKKVSRLRMTGALSNALHMFQNNEF
jgi:hypothetical protein